MSTLFAITLAAAATVQPSCSWDRPGANPYTGNTDAAIDRYTDIPERTRVKLKHRLAYGNPDEMVSITRDAITGKYNYDPEIRDMHFGAASVCHTVTRSKWSPKREEPGAVYCVDQHCILVPKICGNVSRIARPRPAVAAVPPPAVAPAPNWNDHVGDSDLGLVDAPMIEDVPNLRTAGFLPAPMPAAPVEERVVEQPFAGRPVPANQPVFPGGSVRPILPPPNPPGNPHVTPVPEPETYAMLLSGLGLLGFAARRKRRAAAAVAAHTAA
ncbi:hypothetical protein JOD97_001091 [Duganella sp. 1411]|uniref:MHFG family PEP-CTERM protein n=1 Tax=Duganella sp. 1411 TaxID=2806572 RepID=UPI001AE7561F|nr:MHFG family PEP-CTERM protein [Duganella sp. 1411]MBP1203077.1 hypothetical protein [Duganella sp. 1411]